MLDFIIADGNSIYLLLVASVLVIACLEGFCTLVGFSFSSLIDNLTPIDIDAPEGALTKTLGWMCLGRLPVLIWLILLITSFSLSGLTANYVFWAMLGVTLPFMISLPIAFVACIFITRIAGNALIKILPNNESSAVATDSFTGGVAIITIGTARQGSPAEASFTDKYKQKHYVMVEPLAEETFSQGQQVVLIEKDAGIWKGSLLRASMINNEEK
ncbi:YqiJ family protein [Marinomonas balearica]|uniref:Uncharacterized protein DUF1449 n=1 Tax=Marinomonas balearica TaxID=491947 RepID=A0A4R6MHQ4_9GAMM|nr:YqiJ family protein [Marinomonas balearica]TDP01215.1 uncharacterized protein DUF1449 [Marinomonas balearica]